MAQIKNRVWEEYMKVRGGDFAQWYEGLSPIERILFGERFSNV